MKIFFRNDIQIGNESIKQLICDEVAKSLNAIKTTDNCFKVNDTIWQWKNAKGNVTPTVVNSAKFITKIFQSDLKTRSKWSIEENILDQDLDAYKEFDGIFKLYFLDEKDFLPLLTKLESLTGESSGPIATSIFNRLCRNGTSSLTNEEEKVSDFFALKSVKKALRVGLEFETGNIASSFRAIKKLDHLYLKDCIDLGICITSNSKGNCATRIWPTSNRNGSFQELERRGFRSGISIPLFEVGFEPDDFDINAPYLGEDGNTFFLNKIHETITINNINYEIWVDPHNQQRLKKI